MLIVRLTMIAGEDMEVELGRSGFNDLFNYIRMIYAKAKAKRTLLDEFREHVLSKVPHPEAACQRHFRTLCSSTSSS